MIPKSGNRFSEKDHAQTKLERDDDSKKNHPALARWDSQLCEDRICMPIELSVRPRAPGHSCGTTFNGVENASTRNDSCANTATFRNGACSRSPLEALRTAYCQRDNVPLVASELAITLGSRPPSASSSGAERPITISSFTVMILNRTVVPDCELQRLSQKLMTKVTHSTPLASKFQESL